jgi:magnesium transporter
MTEAAEAQPGLGSERVRAVVEALAEGRAAALPEAVGGLDAADTAALIGQLSAEQREEFIEAMRGRLDPEVLSQLDEDVRDEVAERLGTDWLARAVADLESDDALYLIEDLEEARRRQVLHAIPAVLRAQLEEQLAYPENSAGRLMSRDIVAVPEFWTVGACLDDMRESEDLPDDFYDLFVIDARYRPIGTVPLDRLVRSKRPARIADIMEREVYSVPADMDQEDVAYLFKQHDLVSAPVVDRAGRLIGTITIDDVVDVIEEEAEEDMLRLGGVTETDLHRPVAATTRTRFTWLLVNLGTAVLASTVIAQFTESIAKVVALAVLMPIVASMGGNAGTQTLTVAVRGLATRELTAANALRVVAKELAVGGINGAVFALLAGSLAWAWFGSPVLGAVIGAAMIVNLAVAALGGALIPLGLARLGIDPAVASGVFVTTLTDVIGFFAFLGLGAWLLL